MSKKSSGGFGFGWIIFGIIAYNFFSGGDEDKVDVDVKVNETIRQEEVIVDVANSLKEKIDEIGPELNTVVNKAINEFENVKNRIKSKPEEQESIDTDVYSQETDENKKNDDIYGEYEQRW